MPTRQELEAAREILREHVGDPGTWHDAKWEATKVLLAATEPVPEGELADVVRTLEVAVHDLEGYAAKYGTRECNATAVTLPQLRIILQALRKMQAEQVPEPCPTCKHYRPVIVAHCNVAGIVEDGDHCEGWAEAEQPEAAMTLRQRCLPDPQSSCGYRVENVVVQPDAEAWRLYREALEQLPEDVRERVEAVAGSVHVSQEVLDGVIGEPEADPELVKFYRDGCQQRLDMVLRGFERDQRENTLHLAAIRQVLKERDANGNAG